MYADDSSLFLRGSSVSELIFTANQELKLILNWLSHNKLSLNINKCKYIIFAKKGSHVDTDSKLKITKYEIKKVEQIKFLGYVVDSKLSWKPHIQYISSKISKNIAILQKLIVYPYLFNGISVWGLAGVTALSPVIKLQKRIVRLLSCSPKLEHTAPLFKKLNLLPLEYLFKFAILIFMFKCKNHMLPQMFQDCFIINKNCKSKETRQSQLYFIPRARTNYLEKTILVQGPTIANKYKDLYIEPCSKNPAKKCSSDYSNTSFSSSKPSL